MLTIKADQGGELSQRDSKSLRRNFWLRFWLECRCDMMWLCVHLGLSWNHVPKDLDASRISRHLHVQRNTSCSPSARAVSPVMNNPLVCFASGGSNSKVNCHFRIDKVNCSISISVSNKRNYLADTQKLHHNLCWLSHVITCLSHVQHGSSNTWACALSSLVRYDDVGPTWAM